MGMITASFVKNIIERRSAEIHKGDCGKVLLAAGSEGMAGAAVLSAKAALRAGAGLVRVMLPKDLFPILQVGVPEATCLERDLSKTDLASYDAVAIGPGLGRGKEGIDLLRNIMEEFSGPLVIDADGLNLIAEEDLYGDFLRRGSKGYETVITPHIGEVKRLLRGLERFGYAHWDLTGYGSIPRVIGDERNRDKEEERAFLNAESTRQEMASALAEYMKSVVVVKGSGSVVATESGKTYTNTTGNPGMATGGSGDVLTGVIAAFSGQRRADGQRRSALDAAAAGVFVHGLAGDLGAEKLGQYGLTAGDIADFVAFAIKKIQDVPDTEL